MIKTQVRYYAIHNLGRARIIPQGDGITMRDVDSFRAKFNGTLTKLQIIKETREVVHEDPAS